MAGLKTKLEPITTYKKDNTKPLYYEQYEESYVSLGNDWSELALVDMDKINQGTEGYKMTKQEKGDYKFNTDYQLAVNEDGLPTGHYRQNVDHYVFMQGEDETEDGSESVDTGKRGYYSVAFTAVKLPDGMTNTQYLVGTDNSQKADGNTDSGTAGNIDSSTDNTTDTGTADDTSDKHVVYSIKSAYAIGSAEGMQNIAKYDPKAYIYRKDNSDITSPYEFVARADQMQVCLMAVSRIMRSIHTVRLRWSMCLQIKSLMTRPTTRWTLRYLLSLITMRPASMEQCLTHRIHTRR